MEETISTVTEEVPEAIDYIRITKESAFRAVVMVVVTIAAAEVLTFAVKKVKKTVAERRSASETA